MTEGFLIVYVVVGTVCMSLTWNEYLQGGVRLAGVAAGLFACALWPVLAAVMLVAMAGRTRLSLHQGS